MIHTKPSAAARPIKPVKLPKLSKELKAWVSGVTAKPRFSIDRVLEREMRTFSDIERSRCSALFGVARDIGMMSLIECEDGLIVSCPKQHHQSLGPSSLQSNFGDYVLWIEPHGVVRTGWLCLDHYESSRGEAPADEWARANVLTRLRELTRDRHLSLLDQVLAGNRSWRIRAIQQCCLSAARFGVLQFMSHVFDLLLDDVREEMDRLERGEPGGPLRKEIERAAKRLKYKKVGLSSQGARARRLTEEIKGYQRLSALAMVIFRNNSLDKGYEVEKAILRYVDPNKASLTSQGFFIQGYNWMMGVQNSRDGDLMHAWTSDKDRSERRMQALSVLGPLGVIFIGHYGFWDDICDADIIEDLTQRVDNGAEIIRPITRYLKLSPQKTRLLLSHAKKYYTIYNLKRDADLIRSCPENWINNLEGYDFRLSVEALRVLHLVSNSVGIEYKNLILETKGNIFDFVRERQLGNGRPSLIMDAYYYCISAMCYIWIAEREEPARTAEQRFILSRRAIEKTLSPARLADSSTLAQLFRWSADIHRVMTTFGSLHQAADKPKVGLQEWEGILGNFGDPEHYHVHELTSASAISHEGLVMNHCVDQYTPHVIFGSCVLFRLYEGNNHIGTLELDVENWPVKLVQAYGPFNSRLPNKARAFCEIVEMEIKRRGSSSFESYHKKLADAIKSNALLHNGDCNVVHRGELSKQVWNRIRPSLCADLRGMSHDDVVKFVEERFQESS